MCRTHGAYTPCKPSDNAATYPPAQTAFPKPLSGRAAIPISAALWRQATINIPT